MTPPNQELLLGITVYLQKKRQEIKFCNKNNIIITYEVNATEST